VNQVAKDEHLLDITYDFFQFVTKFFEVIKVSAIHIYHSALELCPMSSITRKLYYHRRVTRLPKIVTGTLDSWTQTIAISGKDSYNGSCTWSPCGRFVAARMGNAVEVRNQLTAELITTLHPAETVPNLVGPLAYSPDGRSIACASKTAIIIWDIQTGGMVNEIGCSANNICLVWSLDGRKICAINWEVSPRDFNVDTYDTSGTMLSSSTLSTQVIPHLWTDGESFWVMAEEWFEHVGHTINVFKVGSTLTKIRSFAFPLADGAKIKSFSPTAHRISILGGNGLRILDMQSLECLLHEPQRFFSHCFSSDGNRFAAHDQFTIYIWEYDSGRYVLLEKFQYPVHFIVSLLRFSPTPSSLLGCIHGLLQVWRLHEPPTSSGTHRRQHVGISRSWTHIATAHDLENTITITDLLGQNPPQFIDTDVEIEGLVITGNVLLVAGSGQLIAWLLAEDGVVGGVIGDKRVDRGDSIWAVSKPSSTRGTWWFFRVEGQVGSIALPGGADYTYHTETGDVLDATPTLLDFRHVPYTLRSLYNGRNYHSFHNLRQCDIPSGDSWKTSEATLREGWVKDSEGRHRFWVPAEWRAGWNLEDWRHDVTTQFSYLGGRPVVIKF